MSIPEGIRGYYKLFGIKGLLAISSFRLFGVPKVIAGQTPNIRHPVQLRLRTSDMSIYRDVLLHEEYALEMPTLPRVIVDAGANVGLTTVYYANEYPHAKIIAIEPDDSNFVLLVKNVSAYPNVVPVHAALWNKDGEIGIFDGDGKWGCQVREGIGCRAVTMRTLMSETNVDTIDLLKVDVEGAEKEIFSDCDWIGCVRTLVVELHDRLKPGCRDAVERAARGFRQFERGELTFFLS